MARTLFVGDLHAKPDLLPLISNVAERETVDRIVLLGDYADDWNLSNRGQVEWFLTLSRWWRGEKELREVTGVIGNHDVPYWMNSGSKAFARVRAMAPGFKPGAHRKVHELIRLLPVDVAWSDGRVIATHAGITRQWLDHRVPGGVDMPVGMLADRLNLMMDHATTLASLYMDIGRARGGDRLPGPLWADRRELHADADQCMTQIVGHTPVPTVTRDGDLWLCDTFSTDSWGHPLGDGSMLLMDDDHGDPVFTVVPLVGK